MSGAVSKMLRAFLSACLLSLLLSTMGALKLVAKRESYGQNLVANIELKNTLTQGFRNFSFAQVDVTVMDSEGNVVKGAWIKAFSEEWGVMYPHFETWGITGNAGKYSFNIPEGKWIFIASSGWDYARSHPNRGFFVAVRENITGKTSLILKPVKTITIKVYNEEGSPLPVDEIYALLTSRIPALPPALIGWSPSGLFHLSIGLFMERAPDSNLTIIAIKRTGESSDGYLLVKTAPVSQDIVITSINSSTLQLAAYNPDGSLSYYWDVGLRLPDLYLPNWAFIFKLYGKNTLHVSPMNVLINPRFIPPEWYYYFEGIAVTLEPGQTYSYSFGKRVTFKLWVIKHDTQLYFDVRDEFGNVLAFYDNRGIRNIRLRIFEGSNKVYDDNIGKYIPGTLFYGIGKTFSDNAYFTLDVDLGPLGGLGSISLNGTLYDKRNLVVFRTIHSENFNLTVPVEDLWSISGQSRDKVFVKSLENIYAAIGDFLGEELSLKPHRVEVNFEWCGVAGTSFVGFGLGVARWPINISPNLLNVLSHELGHMYSFTPPLIYGVECPTFCEPLATYLGIEGIAALYKDNPRYSDNVRLWFWGTHPKFFDYIAGKTEFDAIENMQFIFFYLHKTYGPEIHKNFFRIWNTELKKKLLENGFNDVEIAFILYSHLAKENLAWIARLAGLSIPEQRVAEGLALIKSRLPPSLSIWVAGTNGLNVTINGVALPGTQETTITRIHWDWGDGNEEDHWFPASHIYKKARTYTIKVTAYQSNGLSTTKTLTITLTQRRPSSISCILSSESITSGGNVNITGHISPPVSTTVTILYSTDGKTWSPLATVKTGNDGAYSYTWRNVKTGKYYIKASWSGNNDYEGAESSVVLLTVSPLIEQALLALIIIIVYVTIPLVWKLKRRIKGNRGKTRARS